MLFKSLFTTEIYNTTDLVFLMQIMKLLFKVKGDISWIRSSYSYTSLENKQ
jgi:hypothetical protein